MNSLLIRRQKLFDWARCILGKLTGSRRRGFLCVT